MKRFGFPVVTGLLAVLLIGLLPALSQDRGEKSLQEEWAKLHQPGPEHAWLAKEEGEWTVTQRIFMDGTDEPVEVKGEATFTMMWDRYLYEELRIGGVEESNAVSYIGFDNSAREFKAINLGIWGTGMDVISGTRSDDGKTVTMTHEGVEKGLGNLKIAHRFVITHKNDDERGWSKCSASTATQRNASAAKWSIRARGNRAESTPGDGVRRGGRCREHGSNVSRRRGRRVAGDAPAKDVLEEPRGQLQIGGWHLDVVQRALGHAWPPFTGHRRAAAQLFTCRSAAGISAAVLEQRDPFRQRDVPPGPTILA